MSCKCPNHYQYPKHVCACVQAGLDLESELREQARLLGISGSKEAKLLAELAESKAREKRYREALEKISDAPELNATAAWFIDTAVAALGEHRGEGVGK